jgi:hypothetical protein
MDHDLVAYAYVEAPFDTITALLAGDPTAVLQRATTEAASAAKPLARTMGVELAGHAVAETVTVMPGRFRPTGLTTCTMTLTWEVPSGRLLFPHLTAELEVCAVVLDPPLVQVTVRATYEPPAAVLQAGADRMMLKHLAEATLHRFVHEVADGIRRHDEARSAGALR